MKPNIKRMLHLHALSPSYKHTHSKSVFSRTNFVLALIKHLRYFQLKANYELFFSCNISHTHNFLKNENIVKN